MAMATRQLAASNVSTGTVSSSSWSSPSSSPSLLFTRGSSRGCICTHRTLLRHIATSASSPGDAGKVSSDDDAEDAQAEAEATSDDYGSFEERLAKLRRRSKSGTGVKAEKRKARQSGDYVPLTASPKGKGGGDAVLLPPVPLKDPVSDGLIVELGLNSYTERINGRFAALGLAAILLVELATGGSFLKYHGSSIISLQAYFMLAVSALFIKYEKEKIGVWPKS